MRQFGISFETTDFIEKPDLVDRVLKIVRDGVFDFVQLNARMALPEFYDDIYASIKEKMIGIRAVIHAPFYLPPNYLGLNTSNKDELENNLKKLEFSQKCADLLKSDIIVVHPGIGDDEEHINETIRQFQKMNDSRVTVENLPYDPLGYLMHGARVENIKRIVEETNCKFCFDFAHSVCAANSLKRDDIYGDFKQFCSLKPDIYHLSDGDFSTNFDAHLHLGLGNYDIEKFIKEFTNEDSRIILETFNPEPTVDSWIKDAEFLKNLKLA